MDIMIRSIGGKYVEISITEGNTTTETGLLDRLEATAYIREFQSAIDEIERLFDMEEDRE